MSTSKKNFRYPYRWCGDQVNVFVEKYARATYNFARCCGLSAGEVRHSLTVCMALGNSVRFEAFKRAIKVMGDYSDEELARIGPEMQKLLLKSIVVFCQDDEIDARIARDIVDNAQQKRLIL